MEEDYRIFDDHEAVKEYLDSKVDTTDKLIHLYCLDALLKMWTKEEILKVAISNNVKVGDLVHGCVFDGTNTDGIDFARKGKGMISERNIRMRSPLFWDSEYNKDRARKNLPPVPEYFVYADQPSKCSDKLDAIINDLFLSKGVVLWKIQTTFINNSFIDMVIKALSKAKLKKLLKQGYVAFVDCQYVTVITKEQFEEYQEGYTRGQYDLLVDKKIYKRGMSERECYLCDSLLLIDMFINRYV